VTATCTWPLQRCAMSCGSTSRSTRSSTSFRRWRVPLRLKQQPAMVTEAAAAAAAGAAATAAGDRGMCDALFSGHHP
jgi:hypothetical protein